MATGSVLIVLHVDGDHLAQRSWAAAGSRPSSHECHRIWSGTLPNLGQTEGEHEGEKIDVGNLSSFGSTLV